MVTIGIDPHKSSHTAAALDASGESLGELRVRADGATLARLLGWAAGWSQRVWAIEGAGGLGRLLAQQLVAAGETVVDVPPRTVAHEGPVYERPYARPDWLDARQADRAEDLPRPASPEELRAQLLQMVASRLALDTRRITITFDSSKEFDRQQVARLYRIARVISHVATNGRVVYVRPCPDGRGVDEEIPGRRGRPRRDVHANLVSERAATRRLTGCDGHARTFLLERETGHAR